MIKQTTTTNQTTSFGYIIFIERTLVAETYKLYVLYDSCLNLKMSHEQELDLSCVESCA